MSSSLTSNPQAQLQQIVNGWNLQHPIGTRVVLKRGNQNFYTRTTGPAEVLGNIPVIQVEGIPGDFDLDRVKPL